MRTEKVEGCVVEAGPDSFLTEKSWASDYCRQLGLGDELITSNDNLRKTYIVVRGKLVPIPDGLQFLVPTRLLPVVMSPLFSFRTKLRMAREYFTSPHALRGTSDESVAEMIERHYGREVVERLADPLLAGVYGGNSSTLSANSVLPRFVELERRFGSLSRGMLALRKQAKKPQGSLRPIFTSLRGGMQQLSDAAASRLNPAWIQALNSVRALIREADGWRVISARSAMEIYDAVILAAPAPVAGVLLEGVDGGLGSELRQISYSSSMTVALGYPLEALARAPSGFGFLVPRAEKRHMLACTFVHTKFSHRAPAGMALLRCFLGGAHNQSALELADSELLAIVRQELSDLVSITAEPMFARVFRWPGAMAQYSVGHSQRLERISKLVAEHPGLELAGNAYRGIGIPDCIASGQAAAASVLSRASAASGQTQRGDNP